MNVLPVFETRKVLLNHLSAKIWPLCQSKTLGKEIATRMAFNLSDTDILQLLQNESELKAAVCRLLPCISHQDRKQIIGEKLFAAVANIETALCAQVTGMLLEIDLETIESLLEKPELLNVAIQKARIEYLLYTQSAGTATDDIKNDLGEVLYDMVLKYYPEEELAARLTGMILELDIKYIRDLLKSPDDLKQKLLIAQVALEKAEASTEL